MTYLLRLTADRLRASPGPRALWWWLMAPAGVRGQRVWRSASDFKQHNLEEETLQVIRVSWMILKVEVVNAWCVCVCVCVCVSVCVSVCLLRLVSQTAHLLKETSRNSKWLLFHDSVVRYSELMKDQRQCEPIKNNNCGVSLHKPRLLLISWISSQLNLTLFLTFCFIPVGETEEDLYRTSVCPSWICYFDWNVLFYTHF